MQKKIVTEEFLDTYEGEVLFLSQDLEDIVGDINSGNFNQETLEFLKQKLNEVSDVFLSSTYTQHVSPLFKDFAMYVSSIQYDDFKKFSDAVNYLSEIVSDINTYINFYFVERNFSDVYIFQDSLRNSIDFLQRSLSCKTEVCDEDDGSELDFF